MDDCGDSYGEDDEMLGVSDVTCQLAAAGWQNGVHPFIYLFHNQYNILSYSYSHPLPLGSAPFSWDLDP